MASYVYQYFHLLKTIDGYEPLSTHIKEVKSLMRMKFGCLDFDSEQLCDPSQFSLVLAVNILKFSVTKAISLDFLYGFGDEKAFKEMLDQRTKIGSNQPLPIQTVSVQSSLCLSLSAMMKASSTTLLESDLSYKQRWRRRRRGFDG
ncbi:hypothetical protein DY000_02059560 [Brassica cretica]|uniref:FBD domain-containing protein n=1 Tax=Brassica cretica TaxID=69181 RepID=A0ABQ7AQD1_BRACR|nr:hypothetical protein DY000_02059560 [Brassica cretica]